MNRDGRNPGGRERLSLCNKGFSLLELVIVVVIVSVLMVLAMSRLLVVMADAERAAMETTAGVLRSALGMKVAESIVRSKLRELPALEGGNPMVLLAEAPKNYLGELDGADPSRLEDGHWYFDRREGALVYLVRHRAFFEGGQADPPRARFAVRLVYSDSNGNGVFDPGVDEIQGLRLGAMEDYSWSR